MVEEKVTGIVDLEKDPTNIKHYQSHPEKVFYRIKKEKTLKIDYTSLPTKRIYKNKNLL